MSVYRTIGPLVLLLMDFDIVNFPFLDGDVPRRASHGVYISHLIRFARVCNYVVEFNARNKCLTAKLLQQGFRYHKLRKTFSKFVADTMSLFPNLMLGLRRFYVRAVRNQNFMVISLYKNKKFIGRKEFSFTCYMLQTYRL